MYVAECTRVPHGAHTPHITLPTYFLHPHPLVPCMNVVVCCSCGLLSGQLRSVIVRCLSMIVIVYTCGCVFTQHSSFIRRIYIRISGSGRHKECPVRPTREWVESPVPTSNLCGMFPIDLFTDLSLSWLSPILHLRVTIVSVVEVDL